MHTLTVKSDKPLVLISAEEYESMKETLELLAANPHLLQELEQERRHVVEGSYITLSAFKKKYTVK